ncbi:MAG: nucleotide exchange factor GrpE [Hyphomicrobiales bacterium]|nr:MAG: nucleotide exchange factor GrpE [Hyphomicrobiales bacterium]
MTDKNEELNAQQAADNAGGGHSNEDPLGAILDNQAELDAVRAEKTAAFEKLARVQADFTNSRKRLEADFEQRLAFANQTLIEQLLPVIDNFDRALAQDPTKVDAAKILKGITLVNDQFHQLLTKYGVEPIAPNVGDDFDPNLHQAIMQQQSDLPEGKVTLLLLKGFVMKGRVMRAAQVAVSQAK